MLTRQAMLHAVLLFAALARPTAAVELPLGEGRVAVLAGIEVPAQTAGPAAATLAALPAGAAADAGALPDRHGRLRAQVRTPEGGWVQAALVRAGLALVAPAEDVAAAALAELLGLERAARAERRGVWAGGEAGPWPAARVAASPPRYLLVERRALEVARARGFVYVNFGQRWREDFTVRAEERMARKWAKQGFDLTGLAGRDLLVRGLVFEEGGPMIELVHPAQIEVRP